MKNLNDFSELAKTKKFLVTGAGGLVGSSFIDFLEEIDPSVNIIALGRDKQALEQRFKKYLDKSGFKLYQSDVCDMHEDFSVDYIIHAASPAHPLAYSHNPVEVMKANLVGTINMLEIAKKSKARLLFISSGEIYGTTSEANAAFKEDEYGKTDILSPRSCYPESKRAAETLCASYHAEYEVDVVIARLCHVYGAGITKSNSRADAQFLRNALNGENIVMKSTGSQVRSFCYVKDAAVGLAYTLFKGTSGQAYNVANKNSVASVREYAQTLAKLSGVNIINDFPADDEKNGYSKISRAVLNADKLERLGWTPLYDLTDGLRDTLETARLDY